MVGDIRAVDTQIVSVRLDPGDIIGSEQDDSSIDLEREAVWHGFGVLQIFEQTNQLGILGVD